MIVKDVVVEIIFFIIGLLMILKPFIFFKFFSMIAKKNYSELREKYGPEKNGGKIF